MGLNLVKYEGTYFWTGMPSLSRGGANSYFWGRYAPLKKKTPKSGANIGAIAGDLLILSLPILASSLTLAFLIVLLRFDKQNQNDNDNKNSDNQEQEQEAENNDLESYYGTIPIQSQWELIVLLSLGAFFTSLYIRMYIH